MGGPEVLVAGAGPTGLILALALARKGVAVRIVDRKAGPARESRAIGVQARTLELYRMLGLADRLVAAGLPVGEAEIRVEGRSKARLPLRRMGEGVSPYPYLLSYPQDLHEPLLIATLAEAGVAVEWETTLAGFSQDGAGVTATLDRAGTREEVRAGWLVGADGGRSTVRERLGIGFEGGQAEGLFYVADVDGSGIGDHVVLGLGARRLTVMIPLPGRRARLIGIVPPGSEADGRIGFEDVAPDARRYLGIEPTDVAWFSTYHVRHRVAARFRDGRCFLAGDAGHVHSPVGGQGMNTGIGDALNLAWKLAAVVRGEADQVVLDTYGPERIPFARRLVATTDRTFLGLTDEGWLGRTVRVRVMPGLLQVVARLGLLGPALFRTVSQTRIGYRGGALSDGDWGRLAAGDRLPWLPGLDNHAPLDFGWQVHVHGEPPPGLRPWAEARGWPLQAWAWSTEAETAGFRRDGAVLVRPDGHVGCLAEGPEVVAALDAYAARWGLWGGAPPTSPSSSRDVTGQALLGSLKGGPAVVG